MSILLSEDIKFTLNEPGSEKSRKRNICFHFWVTNISLAPETTDHVLSGLWFCDFCQPQWHNGVNIRETPLWPMLPLSIVLATALTGLSPRQNWPELRLEGASDFQRPLSLGLCSASTCTPPPFTFIESPPSLPHHQRPLRQNRSHTIGLLR